MQQKKITLAVLWYLIQSWQFAAAAMWRLIWGGKIFCTSSLVWEQCRDTAFPSLCNYEAGGSLATMTGQHTADTAKGAYLTVHTSVQSAGGEQNTRVSRIPEERARRWDSIRALCRNVTKLPVKRFDLLSMLSVQLQKTCPPFISRRY